MLMYQLAPLFNRFEDINSQFILSTLQSEYEIKTQKYKRVIFSIFSIFTI